MHTTLHVNCHRGRAGRSNEANLYAVEVVTADQKDDGNLRMRQADNLNDILREMGRQQSQNHRIHR